MSGCRTRSPYRNAGRATLVSDFARRCNAVQRAMSLYPTDHPLRKSAVADFVQVADQIVAVQPVSLTVRQDRLLLDGCETQPIDSAVTELAQRLHRHGIGRIDLSPEADSQTWQEALALVARPPAEVQSEGGVVHLWHTIRDATAKGTRPGIEFQEVDYGGLLDGTGSIPIIEAEAALAACLKEIPTSVALSGEGVPARAVRPERLPVVHDVEELTDDPPDRIHTWIASIDRQAVDRLDLQLLDDLLVIEADPSAWRKVAEAVVGRVEDLHRQQDFSAGLRLVDRVAKAVPTQDYAEHALARLVSGHAMRHAAEALRSSDVDVAVVQLLCELVGPSVVSSLVHVHASTRDVLTKRRVSGIVSHFGSSGRQAVRPMLDAPEAEIRGAAVSLLRELGDTGSVSALLPLLTDRDRGVRREAIRALMVLGGPEIHAALVTALTSRGKRVRCEDLVIAELGILKGGQTTAACAHLASNLTTGRHLPVRLAAIEALGRGGGDLAIAALTDVLHANTRWAPFRLSRVRTAAARALRETHSVAGDQVLRDATTSGSRGVRRAARAHLGNGALRP